MERKNELCQRQNTKQKHKENMGEFGNTMKTPFSGQGTMEREVERL